MERIPDEGTQGKPQQHKSNTYQAKEGTEPKQEFHDTKNVSEKLQNQALRSFSLLILTHHYAVHSVPHLHPFLTPYGNPQTGVRALQDLRPYERDPPPHWRFRQTRHTSHRLRHDSGPAVLPIPGRVRSLPSLDQLKKDDCSQGQYGAARWVAHRRVGPPHRAFSGVGRSPHQSMCPHPLP